MFQQGLGQSSVWQRHVRIGRRPDGTCGATAALDIASSNFPRFDVNPNSGEPEGQARHKRIANNTVHLSPGFASRLILTTLAAETLDNLASASTPDA